MNIYIARHGQNEDNANFILNGHRDLPLTETCRQQAHEAAEKIKDAHLNVSAVLSSPLIRAFETATIISEVNGFPKPQSMPDLIERDFGMMTGVKQSRIEELCSPDILKTDTVTYFLSPDGAETFPDLKERAAKILGEIAAQYHDHDDILLVSHSDLGKMIYAQYYDLGWQDVLTQFHFGNSELILLSPDSPANKAHVFEIGQYNL
jgi:probable phosphoglycerate mutase